MNINFSLCLSTTDLRQQHLSLRKAPEAVNSIIHKEQGS